MKRSIVACVAMSLTLLLLSPHAGAVPVRGDRLTGTTPRVRVRIVDNRFRPRSITVDRGTVVKWINRDDVTHTTTSNTGLWDRTLSPGESFRRRFRRRGTFLYHCTIHSNMTGSVTVT